MRKTRSMKKTAGLIALCMILVLTGCKITNDTDEQPYIEQINYSNLIDTSVQKQLAEIMNSADISPMRQQVFFDHVNQFNNTVSSEGMAAGFEVKQVTEEKYDPYAMQEEWDAAYPDFMGYNCRITAFGLFGDHITIAADAETREDMILMDMASLEEDSSAMQNDKDMDRFRVLYSTVPTDDTKDVSVHVENLRSDWKNRGIVFDNNPDVSLISVVFHDAWDGENQLFIGHTGVLFQVSETELYFVEKIAFQEPYQLTIFNNRIELNDYLMTKYDTGTGQPTAAPFIMENDELMEGYRSK